VSWIQDFMGRSIEESVNEYSRVYGEVLMGMHRRLVEHENKLERLVDLVGSEQLDLAQALRLRLVELKRELERSGPGVHETRLELCEGHLRRLEAELSEVASEVESRMLQLSTQIGAAARTSSEQLEQLRQESSSGLRELRQESRTALEQLQETVDRLKRRTTALLWALVVVVGGVVIHWMVV